MHDSHSRTRQRAGRRPAIRPRKQPKQARSHLTVEAIVEAVFRILESEGVAAVTTTRVAAVAGVSVGSLYQYFPSREALLERAHRHHCDAALRALGVAERAAVGRSLEESLRALTNALLAFKRQRPAVSRALLHEMPRDAGLRDKRRLADLCQRRLTSILQTHRTELGGADPATVAARIVGAVEGALGRALRDPRALDAPDLPPVLQRVALAALPPRPVERTRPR